jgi:hypothetical protein
MSLPRRRGYETVERRWDDTVETKSPTGQWSESTFVPPEGQPAREAAPA